MSRQTVRSPRNRVRRDRAGRIRMATARSPRGHALWCAQRARPSPRFRGVPARRAAPARRVAPRSRAQAALVDRLRERAHRRAAGDAAAQELARPATHVASPGSIRAQSWRASPATIYCGPTARPERLRSSEASSGRCSTAGAPSAPARSGAAASATRRARARPRRAHPVVPRCASAMRGDPRSCLRRPGAIASAPQAPVSLRVLGLGSSSSSFPCLPGQVAFQHLLPSAVQPHPHVRRARSP